jgi:uncharacterized protein
MHVTLHLTTGCNLRCDYCYSPPLERHDMPPEIALRAVDLALGGDGPSASIIFFGGEPLLRKDLIALCVAYALEEGRKRGVRPHFKVTTNGLLLDDDFIRFCTDLGIVVAVSLDGCREAHDAHRLTASRGETFDLVRQRCRALLERQPYSLAITVISPDTAQYVDRSVAEVLDLGFRYAIVSLDYSGGWEAQSLNALRRSYRELGEQYFSRTRQEQKFYLSPFETRIASRVRPESVCEERCHLGLRQVSVAPDGTIYPCVQFTRAGSESSFAIGHVSTGFDHQRRCRLYEMSQQEPSACLGCAIRDRCNHTCSCLNWQCTGAVAEVPPILCENERMLLPVVDRIAGRLFKVRDPMFIQKHYQAAYPLLSLLEDLEAAEFPPRR